MIIFPGFWAVVSCYKKLMFMGVIKTRRPAVEI